MASKKKQCWRSRKKKGIQAAEFYSQLGLMLDQPKEIYGSSHDGNTSRRLFENVKISSKITGVEEDFIKGFHIILQVISSGFEINVQKFQNHTTEIARNLVALYPWFKIPTTVHKILIQGYKIIESSLLPIGQMSEEACESCKKYIKKKRNLHENVIVHKIWNMFLTDS